jgi:CubicO group peptidase (beta-lactamase class C family)
MGYSLATDVLGGVIERVAGASLAEVVERTVTAPLNMRDTAFSVRDRSRLVTPYADATPQPIRMSDPHPLPFEGGAIRFSPSRILDPASYPSGGTGMAGTAPDVLVFLEALRRGGEGILRAETVRSMTTNVTGDLPTLLGPGWRFGLGVAVLKDPAAAQSPQGAGTWSWGGVYGHHWFVDPVNALSVVVLTNTLVDGAGEVEVLVEQRFEGGTVLVDIGLQAGTGDGARALAHRLSSARGRCRTGILAETVL